MAALTRPRGRGSANPRCIRRPHGSQSIKTTEEGAGSNRYDAHKNLKGRKRHFLVDTLSLPLSVYVTPADVQVRAGARLLLAGLKPLVPCLKKIWANGAYGGKELLSGARSREGGSSRSSSTTRRPRASRSCRSGESWSGLSDGSVGIGASPRITSGRCTLAGRLPRWRRFGSYSGGWREQREPYKTSSHTPPP